MKIKKDDNIIVISGRDKGKTGKVIKAFPREDKIIVEGINIHKRHRRATRQGQKGQMVDVAHPMHVSNVRKEAGEEAPKKPRATKKKAEATK